MPVDDLAERLAALGIWMKEARQAVDVTIAQACADSGLSRSTWATLEAGGRKYRGQWVVAEPSDRTLVAVARGLGQDPVEVFKIMRRPYAGPKGTLPRGGAAFSGADMDDLTPEEWAQVQGYIDGLRARRATR